MDLALLTIIAQLNFLVGMVSHDNAAVLGGNAAAMDGGVMENDTNNRFGVQRFLSGDVGSWVSDPGMEQHLGATVSALVDQITVWDTACAAVSTATVERGEASRSPTHLIERSYIRRTKHSQPGWKRIK